jgi:putative DNA primase/helicase
MTRYASENCRFPSAAEIITALDGNSLNGRCRCPAHDDNKPSLDVSEGNKGAVWYCHAGCSQEAVRAALVKLRIWPERVERKPAGSDPDEFERFRKAMTILRAAAQAKKARPVEYLKGRGIEFIPKNAAVLPASAAMELTGRRFPAMVLPILDDTGLRGAHVTFLTSDLKKNVKDKDGKSLRRTFGPVKGAYITLGGRLPEADKPLVIAEGIETALAASEITGYPAIAARSAGNMKEIIPPPCSEVIVAGDNDNSGTGRREAETAASAFAKIDRPARVVLPTKHKDWNDALRDPKADLRALRRLFEQAPCLVPAAAASVGMEAFMGVKFPPRRYLLKPWLTTTGLAMLFADAGVGKTRLVLSIGYGVASGGGLLGWRCEHRAPVLFVDGEMPGELLQRWLGELGPTLPEADFQILSHSMLELRGQDMPDLGTEEGRAFLDEVIEKNRIELIILDSVSTLVRCGVENDAESWRQIQTWSLKHRQRGRAVLYLHHTGRSGKMRGTSMREVVIDTAIRLAALPDECTDNETAVELSYSKHRHFFGKDALPLLVHYGTAEGEIKWRGQVRTPAHAEEVEELKEKGLSNRKISEQLGISKQEAENHERD